MGIYSDIAKRLTTFWKKDKDTQATKLARGNTSARLMSGGYGPGGFGYQESVQSWLNVEGDLLSRFADYEEMDDYPELAAALNVFADDATQLDSQLDRTVWVTSKSEVTARLLDDMLHKRLRIDEEIWEIARSLCKYGNDYEELLVTNEGVIGLNFLPAPGMRRIEDCYGALLGFIQTYTAQLAFSVPEFDQLLKERTEHIKACEAGELVATAATAFEGWEVVHFRLRSKFRRSVYGYSVLEPARWIWKRLMMLEDAAILFRLQKAMERYAFYVDVGDMPPAEALAYVNRIRQQYRKRRFVNQTTGKLELQFNPASPDEDFWIPSRAGRDGTRIDLVASPQWQSMDDIEYFRDKLFSSVTVPKAYLGQEQDVARATLSSQDVRFARSVLRVQRELKSGLGKVCRVHLAALNSDPARADFTVHMTVPSAIFELAQIEVRAARGDLAARMADFVPLHYILTQIFGLNDAEAQVLIKQKSEDIVRTSTATGQGEAAAQALINKVPPPPEPAQEEEVAAEGGANPLVALQNRTRQRSRAVSLVSSRDRVSPDAAGIKRMNEKVDLLLRSDQALGKRFRELRALLEDMRAVQGSLATKEPREPKEAR